MSTPLKVRDGDGNIQEFTTADENYLAYQIGLHLLDDSANGFGSLTKNDSADTLVGNFSNTFFNEPVGTHPSTSITSGSTSTFLSQSLGTAAETDSDNLLALKWMDSSVDGPAGFRQMNDTDLNTAVDRYLSTVFTNNYPGSFYLADSAPSADYSVHLTNVFTDTRTDGTSIPYNVYRRDTMTAPSTVRPMFVEDSAGGSGIALREMNDRQIRFSFGQRAKTRIGTSKIGTYQLRSSTAGAPTDPGTWVAKGTAIDTKQTTSQRDYLLSSDEVFQAEYARNYTPEYTASYIRTFDAQYDRNIPYIADYTNEFGLGYTPQPAYTSSTSYTGGIGYARLFNNVNITPDGTFADIDTAVFYVKNDGAYTSVVSTLFDYIGPLNYENTSTSYEAAQYQANIASYEIGNRSYAGTGTTNYTLSYTAAVPGYLSQYVGDNLYNHDNAQYQGQTDYIPSYVGPGLVQYDHTLAGYVGPYASYDGYARALLYYTSGTYTGESYYIGEEGTPGYASEGSFYATSNFAYQSGSYNNYQLTFASQILGFFGISAIYSDLNMYVGDQTYIRSPTDTNVYSSVFADGAVSYTTQLMTYTHGGTGIDGDGVYTGPGGTYLELTTYYVSDLGSFADGASQYSSALESYTANVFYQRDPDPSYTRNYAGFNKFYNTGVGYTGPNFFLKNTFNTYVGPTLVYDGETQYINPEGYILTDPYAPEYIDILPRSQVEYVRAADIEQYLRLYTRSFGEVFQANTSYAPTYTQPVIPYSATYTAPEYTGPGTDTYVGPGNFTPPRQFYTGAEDVLYIVDVYYQSDYTQTYTAPAVEYTRFYTARFEEYSLLYTGQDQSYTSTTPAASYTITETYSKDVTAYIRDLAYAGFQKLFYLGPSGSYVGHGQYGGPTQYYTGPGEVIGYQRNLFASISDNVSNYIGTVYTRDGTGEVLYTSQDVYLGNPNPDEDIETSGGGIYIGPTSYGVGEAGFYVSNKNYTAPGILTYAGLAYAGPGVAYSADNPLTAYLQTGFISTPGMAGYYTTAGSQSYLSAKSFAGPIDYLRHFGVDFPSFNGFQGGTHYLRVYSGQLAYYDDDRAEFYDSAVYIGTGQNYQPSEYALNLYTRNQTPFADVTYVNFNPVGGAYQGGNYTLSYARSIFIGGDFGGFYGGASQYVGTVVYQQASPVDTAYLNEVGIQYVSEVADSIVYGRDVTYITAGPDYTRELGYVGAGSVYYTSANYDTYVSNTQTFAARYDVTGPATAYSNPAVIEYTPTYTGGTLDVFQNIGFYIGEGYLGYIGPVLFSDYIAYQGPAPAEYLRESQFSGLDPYTRDPVYYNIQYDGGSLYTGVTGTYDGFAINYIDNDGNIYAGTGQQAFGAGYVRSFANVGVYIPTYSGGPSVYYELEGASFDDYVVHQLFIGGTFTRDLYAGPTLYDRGYTAPGVYVGGDTPEGVQSFAGPTYTRAGPTTAFGPNLNPGIVYSPAAYVGPISDTTYTRVSYYGGPGTTYANFIRFDYVRTDVYSGAPVYDGPGGSFTRLDEIYQGSYASYVPLGYLGFGDEYLANYTSGAEPHYVNQYTGPARTYANSYQIEDTRITDQYDSFVASYALYAGGEYSRIVEYNRLFVESFSPELFGRGRYSSTNFYESAFAELYLSAYLNYLGPSYVRDFTRPYDNIGYNPTGTFTADYTGPSGAYETGYDATATYTGFAIQYYVGTSRYDTGDSYTRYPYEGTAFQNYTVGATSVYQADLYSGLTPAQEVGLTGTSDTIRFYTVGNYTVGDEVARNYVGILDIGYLAGGYLSRAPDGTGWKFYGASPDYIPNYGIRFYTPDPYLDNSLYAGDYQGANAYGFAPIRYDGVDGYYIGGSYVGDQLYIHFSPGIYVTDIIPAYVDLEYTRNQYTGPSSVVYLGLNTYYAVNKYASWGYQGVDGYVGIQTYTRLHLDRYDKGYTRFTAGGAELNYIRTYVEALDYPYGGDPYTGPAPGILQYAGLLDTIYYTGDRTVVSSFIPYYTQKYVEDKGYLRDDTNIIYEGEATESYSSDIYSALYSGIGKSGTGNYLGTLGPLYQRPYTSATVTAYQTFYLGPTTSYGGYLRVGYGGDYEGPTYYLRGFQRGLYSGPSDYVRYYSGPGTVYDNLDGVPYTRTEYGVNYTEPDREQYDSIFFQGPIDYIGAYLARFGEYEGLATTALGGAYGPPGYQGPTVFYEGSQETVFNKVIYNPHYSGGGVASAFARYIGATSYNRQIIGFGQYVPEAAPPGQYTGLINQEYYELSTVFAPTFLKGVEYDAGVFFYLSGPYTGTYLRAEDYTRHYTTAGPTLFASQYSRNLYYTSHGRNLAPVYSTDLTFVRKYATGYVGDRPSYSIGYTGEITYIRAVTMTSYTNLYSGTFQDVNPYNRELSYYTREILESFTPGTVYQANYTTDVTYVGSNYIGSYLLSYEGEPQIDYASIVSNYGGYIRSNVYASTYIGDVNYQGSTDYVLNAYGRFSAPIAYVQNIYAGYLGNVFEGYAGPAGEGLGTSYTGIGSETYSGPNTVYERSYERAGALLNYTTAEIYTTEFGSAVFTASFGYTGVGKVFTGVYDENRYVRHYVLSYILDPIPYTKENAGNYLDAGVYYTGPRAYNLGPAYIGPGEDQYLLGPGYYNRGYIASYDVNYTRTFVDSYTKDDTYTNTYLTSYARVETQFEYYQVFYTNLAFYIAEQYASGQYAGPLGLTYGVNVQYITAEYEGDAPYLKEYIGPGYIPYEQEYLTDYTGTYVGNFEGLTIDSDGSETIETYTLYVRIA